MKTPTDVYNRIQVILAQIEDIKLAKAITAHAEAKGQVFGKKPSDVLMKFRTVLQLIGDISVSSGVGEFNFPALAQPLQPRDIFASATLAVQQLELIKRRIGAVSHHHPKKAEVRISPSHVFRELLLVEDELGFLREFFADKGVLRA